MKWHIYCVYILYVCAGSCRLIFPAPHRIHMYIYVCVYVYDQRTTNHFVEDVVPGFLYAHNKTREMHACSILFSNCPFQFAYENGFTNIHIVCIYICTYVLYINYLYIHKIDYGYLCTYIYVCISDFWQTFSVYSCSLTQ